MAAADQDAQLAQMELDEAAHTLLRGMRAVVVGHVGCPALRRMFADLCGGSADAALNMLFVVMKQLAFTSRRRLRVHMPGCCGISGDELMFLSAIAAAQAEAGGDRRCMDQWLSRLTGGEADPALAGSVRSLGALLAATGCRVSFGELLTSTAPASPTSPTLH